jgi:hypothetical protein
MMFWLYFKSLVATFLIIHVAGRNILTPLETIKKLRAMDVTDLDLYWHHRNKIIAGAAAIVLLAGIVLEAMIQAGG